MRKNRSNLILLCGGLDRGHGAEEENGRRHHSKIGSKEESRRGEEKERDDKEMKLLKNAIAQCLIFSF